MDDMYHAYRKAKVDTFYERSQVCALDFVKFEENLSHNLEILRGRLTGNFAHHSPLLTQPLAWHDDHSFIGRYAFIPKGLKRTDTSKTATNTQEPVVFSDPWDEWKSRTDCDEQQYEASFRPVAQMNVEMHIVCALWVNLVGEKYDRCLDTCCRGSRLKRITPKETPTVSALSGDHSDPGDYHKEAIGSFVPYFDCYREWRDGGFRAIKAELDAGNTVIAVTMDLAKFYHRIDPNFLLDPRFLEQSRFAVRNGTTLSPEETIFTRQMITAIGTWGRSLPTYDIAEPIGLPVGTSAASIIANVLLVEFDRLVRDTLCPAYYARYVDDIFLVIRESDPQLSRANLFDKLCIALKALDRVASGEDVLRLRLPYAENSILEFSGDKQRVFVLRGEMGADFIDTIKSKINEVSSESRLMPDLDDMNRSPAARVLTANRTTSEDADALRKADSLSLRRLGFAALLRSMDAAARDLPPGEWEEQRHARYAFSCRHIITPLRLFDFESYVPRLLALAVECRDWLWAKKMLAQLQTTVQELEGKVTVNAKCSQAFWLGFRRHLRMSLATAVYRSLSWTNNDGLAATSLIRAIDNLEPTVDDFSKWIERLSGREPEAIAMSLWLCDLAKRPFKDSLLQYDDNASEKLRHCFRHLTPPDLPCEGTKRVSEISSIATSLFNEMQCGENRIVLGERLIIRPLLYPTRPLSPSEITDCIPSVANDVSSFVSTIRSLRGTYVSSIATNTRGMNDGVVQEIDTVTIGGSGDSQNPRVAVTSWFVDDRSWSCAAAGSPDLSASRYQRLVLLANTITRTGRKERPRYVVFPELSIPRRWLPGLAQHFLRHKISLIVGAEYRTEGDGERALINEAKLFLTDNRLGYPHGCVLTQRKVLPAHAERASLRQMFGKSFSSATSFKERSSGGAKRIYRHFGFEFGVLVCSELTNIELRTKFRGRVDALFILAWNRDLDSFASLVESSALDVHCYVILANNRKYGDSRVRTPCVENWRRDLVRLKGGFEDYFVVTEIDINALRRFQSNFEPPTGDGAVFKPFPEGFRISPSRWALPTGLHAE